MFNPLSRQKKAVSTKKSPVAWGTSSLPLSVDQNVVLDSTPRRYGKRKFNWSRWLLLVGCVGALGGFLINDGSVLFGSWGSLQNRASNQSIPNSLYYNGNVLNLQYKSNTGGEMVAVWKGNITVAAIGTGGQFDNYVGSVQVSNATIITDCNWSVGQTSEACQIYKNGKILVTVTDEVQNNCWLRYEGHKFLIRVCPSSFGDLYPLIVPAGVISLSKLNL